MQRSITRTHGVQPRGANSQVQRKNLVVSPESYAQQTPFLLLSEDWFGPPGGFEAHPHRGVQTVTIVLGGALEHRDHTGGHGVLRPGDVQWMTAGRGVMHSEMPHQDETAHTLQLWLNLPARMKMIPARYADQPLATVPVRRADGATVLVYAGRSGAVAHPHGSDWPMTLLDLRLEAGASFEQEVPADHRAFLYVIEGRGRVGASGTEVEAGRVAWSDPTGPGGDDLLAFSAESGFRALLFSGPPIEEPVAFGGPFVMNTQEEIRQAFLDYQSGRFLA